MTRFWRYSKLRRIMRSSAHSDPSRSSPFSALYTLLPAPNPLSTLLPQSSISPFQNFTPSIQRLPLSALYSHNPPPTLSGLYTLQAPRPLSALHPPSASPPLHALLPIPAPTPLSNLHPQPSASPSQHFTPSTQHLPLGALLPHSRASPPQSFTPISPDT